MSKAGQSTICERCGSLGPEKRVKRGYELASWVLFYLFIAGVCAELVWPSSGSGVQDANTIILALPTAWLAHVAFRFLTTKKVCPGCGVRGKMVPLDTPRGQQLHAELKPATPSESNVVAPAKGRWPLRLAGVVVAVVSLAASITWAVALNPSPTQACWRFAQNVVDRNKNGEFMHRELPGEERALNKMKGACAEFAGTIKEVRGREVYVQFLNCVRGAKSDDGLKACATASEPAADRAASK